MNLKCLGVFKLAQFLFVKQISWQGSRKEERKSRNTKPVPIFKSDESDHTKKNKS